MKTKGLLPIGYSCLWAVFLLPSCEKTPALSSGTILGGHAGSGIDVEETPDDNTAKAVNYCFAMGAEAVELDVQMSQDGVLFAWHNEFLEDKTRICAQSADVIQHKKNAPEPLSFVVPHIPENGILILDPKIYAFCQDDFDDSTFVSRLQSIAQAYNFEVYLQLSSSFLFPAAKSLNWPTYYAGYDYQDSKNRALSENFEGIALSNNVLSTEDVEDAHATSLKIITYNIRSAKALEQAIAKKVDVILVDQVALISNY